MTIIKICAFNNNKKNIINTNKIQKETKKKCIFDPCVNLRNDQVR